MAQTNTLSHALHDLGLATWFGGSLMGAVGLNGAAGVVDDPRQRSRVANSGWARWQPVNAVGIAAHLVGAVGLVRGNRGRLVAQEGVGRMTSVKGALELAALATTAYSGLLGRRLQQTGDFPAESGAVPAEGTQPEVERALQRQRVLQWAIPALTGTLLVLAARMDEQQRPQSVARGVLRRVVPST